MAEEDADESKYAQEKAEPTIPPEPGRAVLLDEEVGQPQHDGVTAVQIVSTQDVRAGHIQTSS